MMADERAMDLGGSGGIPAALRDFVFDLYDSVRTSQIPSEQHALYTGAFRDLTSKLFAQNPWPSVQSISEECDGDPLFLALYHELTLRHLHSFIRPNVHDRIDGWHVYRTLFDLLIEEFDPDVYDQTEEGEVIADSSMEDRKHEVPSVYILPEWAFDILYEFVYQFQGFCQFRITTMANASKYAAISSNTANSQSSSEPTVPLESVVDGDKKPSEETLAPSSESATPETTIPSTSSNPSGTTISRKYPPSHLVESVRVLNENKDAWAVETVLYYLHRLVAIGSQASSHHGGKKKNTPANPAMQYLGVFASVTLSRLECLLGDYTASLAALAPLKASPSHPNFYGLIQPPFSVSSVVGSSGGGTGSDEVILPALMVTSKPSKPEDVVSSVLSARISMSYHAGVSYLMLRRYKDAISVLSDTCAMLQRGLFKSVGYTPPTVSLQQQQQQQSTPGVLPSTTVTYRRNLIAGFDQVVKMYDRMVALLAILDHICSILPDPMDENVKRIILDRHGLLLGKIEAGEDGYEELFLSACPKFIHAAVPDYENAFVAVSSSDTSNRSNHLNATQDAIKLQVNHFLKEVSLVASTRKLRSYMKLYTSISIEKLGRLVLENDFMSTLIAYKHKMYQLEQTAYEGDGLSHEMQSLSLDKLDLAMDIHYHINDNIIHIDEEEKQNRFENYFIAQINQNNDILKDVKKIIATM